MMALSRDTVSDADTVQHVVQELWESLATEVRLSAQAACVSI